MPTIPAAAVEVQRGKAERNSDAIKRRRWDDWWWHALDPC
jgi:hypothetical protein